MSTGIDGVNLGERHEHRLVTARGDDGGGPVALRQRAGDDDAHRSVPGVEEAGAGPGTDLGTRLRADSGGVAERAFRGDVV